MQNTTVRARRALVVVLLALFVLGGCWARHQAPRAAVLSDVACDRLAKAEANRRDDLRDPAAIVRLVEVLLQDLKDEAALYYYPYGGSVDGLDTSGVDAEQAGRTLQAALRS